MRILAAAVAAAVAVPSAVEAQGGAAPAQTAPKTFSELVEAGYEVRGFAVLPRAGWEGAAMLQRQASVYLCDLRTGGSREPRESASRIARSRCYLVGGGPTP